MKDAERTDALVLLLTAGTLLSITALPHAARWLAAGAALARSPLVPVLAGSALVGLVALLLTRQLVTRRALRNRGRFLLPADVAVARFASGPVRPIPFLVESAENREAAGRRVNAPGPTTGGKSRCRLTVPTRPGALADAAPE